MPKKNKENTLNQKKPAKENIFKTPQIIVLHTCYPPSNSAINQPKKETKNVHHINCKVRYLTSISIAGAHETKTINEFVENVIYRHDTQAPSHRHTYTIHASFAYVYKRKIHYAQF